MFEGPLQGCGLDLDSVGEVEESQPLWSLISELCCRGDARIRTDDLNKNKHVTVSATAELCVTTVRATAGVCLADDKAGGVEETQEGKAYWRY